MMRVRGKDLMHTEVAKLVEVSCRKRFVRSPSRHLSRTCQIDQNTIRSDVFKDETLQRVAAEPSGAFELGIT
jgi:hypothetical protein